LQGRPTHSDRCGGSAALVGVTAADPCIYRNRPGYPIRAVCLTSGSGV